MILKKQTNGKLTISYFKHHLSRILRDVALILLLILATSHERANPKLGNTHIDFYINEFVEELNTQFYEEKSPEHFTLLQDSVITTSVKDIFITNSYLPLWSTNFKTNHKFQQFRNLLDSSQYFGLNRNFYGIQKIDSLKGLMGTSESDKINTNVRVSFELSTTYAYILFALHLGKGINAIDTSTSWNEEYNKLISYIIDVHSNQDIADGLLTLQPDIPQYVNLQMALSAYLSKVDISASSPLITRKSSEETLTAYFKSYWSVGDSVPTDSAYVQESILEFQAMHGITVTGKLNRRTVEAMNVPKRYRYYQAALNLDRLRKLNMDDANSIFVNIPEYKLHIFDNNKVVKQHDIVVGTTKNPTPVLESKIDKVVANPYWTVPRSIAVNELLPKLKKDSTYLQRNRYQLVDKRSNPIDPSTINWNTITGPEFNYWFKQNKGQGNALGVVKFLFPNEHSVYLHDTPSKSKFKYTVRAYSHGCVRVKNPEDLAEYVINNFYVKAKKDIKDVIQKNEHKVYKLDVQIPVYIKYITCSTDEKGDIRFLLDIYKKDKEEIRTLFPDYQLPV